MENGQEEIEVTDLIQVYSDRLHARDVECVTQQALVRKYMKEAAQLRTEVTRLQAEIDLLAPTAPESEDNQATVQSDEPERPDTI